MKNLKPVRLATLLTLISVVASSPVLAQNQVQLVQVAQSDRQWTGVAVSQDGRIFVNFPRWSPQVPVSVAEIMADGTQRPFPDTNWNIWRQGLSPREHFVCVQSVYVDDQNSLWILDPANPNFKGVVQGGPKLVKVDLQKNRAVQTIRFDEAIAPQNSYLNDVRVDSQNGYAYITDSGAGALVVVNLKTGRQRRVLDNDFSTQSEGTRIVINGKPWGQLPNGSRDVHVDGIALDAQGRHLYFHALTGLYLRRIETRWLQDETLSGAQLAQKVETLGPTGPTDGMEVDRLGNVYLTVIADNAIKRFAPDKRLETVVEDERLAWPDSLAWSGNWLFVTTSQIHFGQNPPGPYRLFKFVPGPLLTPTGRQSGRVSQK
ncbi:MAG TPA: L-dopachrome tautomerase-related protein [Clostridia bacterium]|nr:L-dopachrome tautomerase-related protein [Clostridia bacterium]